VLNSVIATLLGLAVVDASGSGLKPISLHAGLNQIRNIAGDGKVGSISVDWRENGNAWGYSIIIVRAGGSIATVGDDDHFTARPHTGEDVITAVRFARGTHKGRTTTFALVADRNIEESVPNPASTTIKTYALERNKEALGTPYHFVEVSKLQPKRRYCNADMALKTELKLPLPRDYSGPPTLTGC
jgi:hypothetical protein